MTHKPVTGTSRPVPSTSARKLSTASSPQVLTSFQSATRRSTKLKTCSQASSEIVSNRSESRINSVDVEHISITARQRRIPIKSFITDTLVQNWCQNWVFLANSKKMTKKFQTAKRKFLQRSFFKMPNLSYL